MTATDELRRLLDERGVEWVAGTPIDNYIFSTFWLDANGVEWRAVGVNSDCETLRISAHITPAQAIEATLGRGNAGRYVGLRQGKYWERTENSDYYCGGCGWKVTDHDSYCPECGGALHKATLGRGECHDAEDSGTDFCCSACGARLYIDTGDTYTMIAADERTIIERPNYCPNCGRRVVDA